MDPKDLRTLRRPLNVVAIPAPQFLDVSEANVQRPDHQPTDLRKSALLYFVSGPRERPAVPQLTALPAFRVTAAPCSTPGKREDGRRPWAPPELSVGLTS